MKTWQDQLFELHLQYTMLCANDVINEDEHGILEDALDVIFDSIQERKSE